MDLKQGLMNLRISVAVDKKEYDHLVEKQSLQKGAIHSKCSFAARSTMTHTIVQLAESIVKSANRWKLSR